MSGGNDSLRILHVDDDISQLQMLRLIVEHLDASVLVESCESPVEAVKRVTDESFDCIVSDYYMPELNGIDLAEKVIAIKNIPFILYTGQGSEEVAERAFSVGIQYYIRKEIEPSHYEVLLNSVRQAVNKHRAEQMYRVVFESNPDAIFVSYNNLIRYANSAAAAIFGVEDEKSLNGKNFIDYIIEGDPDELTWMSLKRIVSETSVIPFEFDIKGEDNLVRRVMGNLQNILFMGDPSQIYFLRDVTAARRVESSLLHTTHRFDKLFELSPVGVAFVTLSGSILKSNKSFRKILGIEDKVGDFKLLHEPDFYRRITGRAMEDDSLNFECSLDLAKLTSEGYIESSLEVVRNLSVIISPLIDMALSDLFLIQIQSSD